MEDVSIAQEKYKSLERISEFFTYSIILSGLLVIQLPLPIDLNKNVIYVVSFLVLIFAIFWHRLLPKESSGLTKNFVESLVGIVGLFLIVKYTGGVRSYFYFLYFPSVLSSSVYMPLRASLVIASTISLLTMSLIFSS